MFAIDIYDRNENCSVFSITNTLNWPPSVLDGHECDTIRLIRQREHQSDSFFFLNFLLFFYLFNLKKKKIGLIVLL